MRVMRISGMCAGVLAAALAAATGLLPAAAQGASARPASGLAAPSAVALQPPGRTGLPGLQPALGARPDAAQASPGHGILSGVYCTTRRSCWAVGQRITGSGAEVNDVLRWNGSTWHRVSAPNPGGSSAGDLNYLFAVRCVTAADCWAVGEYGKGGSIRGEALRWNGTRWKFVSTPVTGGYHKGNETELFDVTCTSAASCWIAGDFGRFTGSVMSSTAAKVQNLALHWNGRRWSRVRTPEPAGARSGHMNALYAVRCVSRASCNAVGTYGTTGSSPTLRNQVLHWNGRKWTQAHTPNPGGTGAGHINELNAVGCASGRCFAVGLYGTQTSVVPVGHDEILRWNGRHWTKARAPDPAYGQLYGVTCVTARDCWAVGTKGPLASKKNQAVHWNGRKWYQVRTPDPGTGQNFLIGVRCTSATNCWAVGLGGTSGGLQEEILRWNGTKWSVWS